MNNQDLIQKMLSEVNLSAEEQSRLDHLLSESEPVKTLVEAMPSEMLLPINEEAHTGGS